MKSRRLKWAPSSSGGLTLPHRYARRLVCTTAKLIVEWQRWVKIGRRGDVRSTTAVPQSGSPSAILLDRKRASSRQCILCKFLPLSGSGFIPIAFTRVSESGSFLAIVNRCRFQKYGARSTFIFAAFLARPRPTSRRQSSRRVLRATKQVLEFPLAPFAFDL
jgi:hypothetical protein